MYNLSDSDYKYISSEIYSYAGINLTQKKRSLIVSRLSKRIRALGLNGFPAYIEYLRDRDPDKIEFQRMVDALSTNYSLFFREAYHFEFLAETILPELSGSDMNIWSAASSTGQEIYSLLITLLEYEKHHKTHLSYNLYASDISTDVLKYAAAGIYPGKDIEKVDHKLVSTYFLNGSGSKAGSVKVKKELVKKVRFFKLNLSDSAYRLPKMDVIFLRNVIIYFDKVTKIELISKLHRQLNPGGYLFLGHSESLAGISDMFQSVGKTIYKRRD